MMENRDRLLNVEQVRERLQCSRKHVYNLINAGELPAIRLGVRKGLRVKLSELEYFLEDREVDDLE